MGKMDVCTGLHCRHPFLPVFEISARNLPANIKLQLCGRYFPGLITCKPVPEKSCNFMVLLFIVLFYPLRGYFAQLSLFISPVFYISLSCLDFYAFVYNFIMDSFTYNLCITCDMDP